MQRRLAVDDQHRAEPPRVVIAQARPVVEDNIDMVVLTTFGRCADNLQTAGHAQMDEQRCVVEPEQQVLASAIDRADRPTRQAFRQILGNRPTQSSVVHLDGIDAAPAGMNCNAAPRCLYFGKFRH